jgi:hypothetical protein
VARAGSQAPRAARVKAAEGARAAGRSAAESLCPSGVRCHHRLRWRSSTRLRSTGSTHKTRKSGLAIDARRLRKQGRGVCRAVVGHGLRLPRGGPTHGRTQDASPPAVAMPAGRSGRDRPFGRPPGQNPAGGFPAPGSHRRLPTGPRLTPKADRLAVLRGRAFARAVSSTRFLRRASLRPRPFPPSTRRALPASSPTSSVLWPRPTSPRLPPWRTARRVPTAACHRVDGEAPWRSPSFQTNDSLNVPNSLDPGGSTRSTSILRRGAVAFDVVDSLGSRADGNFGALSPGPFIRPSTLRPAGRPTQRKRWTSRGWTPFGAGLA